MADAAFWFLCGSGLTWIAMSLRRDGYWREYNSRRRGSNPSLPGRKPAPPAGPPEQPLTAQLIRLWAWLDPAMGEPWPEDCKPPPDVAAAINLRLDRDIAIARRKRGLSPYGWGPRQLNPPPPAPGMRREWLWSPFQMAECGGPCWEAQDPRRCDCGALWRDVPIRMDDPGPPVKPEFPPPRKIREDFL